MDQASFIRDFQDFIQAQQLLKPDQNVLIAVSGGVDSMVLTDLLLQTGFSIGLAHGNFGLRAAEADADEKMIREFGLAHDLTVFVEKFSTKEAAANKNQSIQMTARELRYEWLEHVRQAGNFDAIATAHHLDDQVETILLNLTKGTGLKGLHGIPVTSGHVIRPLMFTDRTSILEYANQAEIQWHEDTSNQSTKYQRNLVRHEVIPTLKKINPSLEQTFDDNAARVKQIEQVWQQTLETAGTKIFTRKGNWLYLHIEALRKLNPLQPYLFEWLSPYGFNADTVGNIMQSLDAQPGKQFFSEGYVMEKDRQYLILHPNKTAHRDQMHINTYEGNGRLAGKFLHWNIISVSMDPPPADLKDPSVAYVDLEKLEFPLVIRPWQEGDRFVPIGMSHFKKLSDYLVDEKYALPEKAATFVVETNGHIASIVGGRVDQRFAISKASTQALRIENA